MSTCAPDMFRTSIATVCLAGTLEEKLRAVADAGFDGVEVFEPDLVSSPLSPEQIRELAAELGLTLDLYQPFRDLEGVEEEVFRENLRRLEAKCVVMNRLGIDLLLVCSNVGTASRWEDSVAVDQLGRAADTAARYGIRLAYEALAWGKFVNTYRHAWSLVERADRPNLGVCLDSFHVLSRYDDVSGISRIPGDRIFFVQLADAAPTSLDVLDWSRHHRNFPGEGALDVPGFMREVAAAGYTGPVSLEVFSDIYRQTDTERTARTALRSLTWLHRHLTRRHAAEPTGWDFAELSAAEPEDLVRTLTQLGFVDRGVHRTKDVRLLTAGEARVVINDQPDPSLDRRGVSDVAAIGVQLPDPAESALIARELGYPQAWRANRADEMVLRGVEAPDGTEVFLSASAAGREPEWTGEFGDGGAAEDDGLVLGIDHVNLAQPWERFDEALGFHRAVLGLHDQAPSDVVSPQGLVRSQVMRTRDGAVRLPLNLVPHGMESARVAGANTSGRRRDTAGLRLRAAYPQHIAFRVSDAVEAARRARGRGLRMLPVPANYYEDLGARFDLPADVVATLRAHDVLYDRDEHGEFLHFYTRTVGSVFFEIVERRDGYEGYGAPSAPVRLAAQYDLSRR